ncbi:DUF6034 family protein [Frisingicoccus sp.]|uniref:DUF6034 family protein n=1 Tax=Frisingicoccus sp. TaxID=1918627 RepID=UPI002ECA44AF|nr:DUF6034 family protein [Frisingicoccus sp.]
MKKRIIILTAMMAFMLTGCQENPKSSIVVNKDMDKLIEQAQETGSGIEGVGGEYDIYKTEISDESLHVTLNVDAKVDIPEADQMSVFRVQQTPITQELLNKVIEELAGSETLYDGCLLSVRTRDVVAEEIQQVKAKLENVDQTEEEVNREVMREEYEGALKRLQAEYENAPSQLQWETYKSDGVIHTVEDMKNLYPNNEFYEWQHDLNSTGDVFYGVSDGKDGNYKSIFVQNNENLGNAFRYRSSKNGYEFTAVAYVSGTNLDKDRRNGLWKTDEQTDDNAISQKLWQEMSGESTEIVEYVNEPTTISETEALTIADGFMEKIGLSESFKYEKGGLYCEILDIRSGDGAEHPGYRKEWILRYSRNMDNVFVTYVPASKHEEGWNGNEYVKRDWPVECIEFRITDEGIVGFDYNAPLEIIETVVEDAGMKSFDEVKETFEKMAMVANAEESVAEGSTGTMICVEKVILGYTRISEADSYDTGLLVPVWDFMGTVTNSYGVSNYGSVLTINAIDGSVINRSVGY